MTTILLIITVALLLVIFGLQVAALLRKPKVDLLILQQIEERLHKAVADEIAKAAQAFRHDMSTVLQKAGDTLNKNFTTLADVSSSDAKALREEAAAHLESLNNSVLKTIGEMATLQKSHFEQLEALHKRKLDYIRRIIEHRLVIIEDDVRRMLSGAQRTVKRRRVRSDEPPKMFQKQTVTGVENGDGKAAIAEYNPETEKRIKRAIKQRGGRVFVDRTHPDGPVVGVDYAGTRVTDAELEQLKELKNLRELNLGDTAITDAGLEHLKYLKKLQSLILEHTQLNGAGITHIGDILGLTRLDMGDTPITDADLELLTGLTNLEWLSLWNTRITANGLRHLSGLTCLHWLDLANTNVADDGSEHLRGLSNLQSLDLGGTAVTDASVQHLRGLTQLRTLDLKYTSVADAGVEHLTALGNLETLDLSGTRVTDGGIEHLGLLQKLHTLCLANTGLSDTGLQHLQGLAQLVWLRIQGTRVTDTGVEHLKGLTTLRRLDARRTDISNDGIETLQHILPNCTVRYSIRPPRNQLPLQVESQSPQDNPLLPTVEDTLGNSYVVGQNVNGLQSTPPLSPPIGQDTPLERDRQHAHDMVLQILWNLEKENGPVFVQDLKQAVLGDPCNVDFRGLGYGQFGDVLQDMQANKYVALHRRPGEQYWRVGSTNEQTAWIQNTLQ